jgi:hypothetical protein
MLVLPENRRVCWRKEELQENNSPSLLEDILLLSMRDCMIKACFCWCCFVFMFGLGFLSSWFRVLGDLGLLYSWFRVLGGFGFLFSWFRVLGAFGCLFSWVRVSIIFKKPLKET